MAGGGPGHQQCVTSKCQSQSASWLAKAVSPVALREQPLSKGVGGKPANLLHVPQCASQQAGITTPGVPKKLRGPLQRPLAPSQQLPCCCCVSKSPAVLHTAHGHTGHRNVNEQPPEKAGSENPENDESSKYVIANVCICCTEVYHVLEAE